MNYDVKKLKNEIKNVVEAIRFLKVQYRAPPVVSTQRNELGQIISRTRREEAPEVKADRVLHANSLRANHISLRGAVTALHCALQSRRQRPHTQDRAQDQKIIEQYEDFLAQFEWQEVVESTQETETVSVEN